MVIGGCDGRELSREYYREVAERLPRDTVILTAGCTKYLFFKLDLGDRRHSPGCSTPASATTATRSRCSR